MLNSFTELTFIMDHLDISSKSQGSTGRVLGMESSRKIRLY